MPTSVYIFLYIFGFFILITDLDLDPKYSQQHLLSSLADRIGLCLIGTYIKDPGEKNLEKNILFVLFGRVQ